MRVIRWLLLIGWLLLIVSLLLPALHFPAALVPPCPQGLAEPCEVHRQPGNRLFWGTVVPVGLLLIGAISHEIWRRICPLAFVSQLARALGRQRSRPGRKGRPELVMVKPESWLGRHHLTLQWSLLIAGLCLRLLAVNGSPLGLAILLLLTLVAALLVGWAWGGKAWRQYVCPMGPVQTVLTGLRGPLGSIAHVGTSSKISQSMCRTFAAEGHEQSACVACQAPCIDIDSERSFWQTLRGKRGLSWIWFSYPGLILAFFPLMQAVGAGSGLENHSLSPFLESQRRGQQDPDREGFAAIAASPLFDDLLADDVLWVAREGSLRTHPAHAVQMERGAAGDELALVLSGALRVQTAAGQSVELGAGQTVGAMGVITGRPRSAAVQAGPEGARMLVLPARSFEELLQRSRRFDRGLLTQLACRLSAPAMEPRG